jgi:hypothetical protein
VQGNGGVAGAVGTEERLCKLLKLRWRADELRKEQTAAGLLPTGVEANSGTVAMASDCDRTRVEAALHTKNNNNKKKKKKKKKEI